MLLITSSVDRGTIPSLKWCHLLQSPAIRHKGKSSKPFSGSFVLNRILSLEGKDQISDIHVRQKGIFCLLVYKSQGVSILISPLAGCLLYTRSAESYFGCLCLTWHSASSKPRLAVVVKRVVQGLFRAEKPTPYIRHWASSLSHTLGSSATDLI